MWPKASRAALAAFLLFAVASAFPHDDHAMGMDMDMNMESKMDSTPTHAPHPEPSHHEAMSYFAYGKHSGMILTHIGLMVLAWCFVLPSGKFISTSDALILCHRYSNKFKRTAVMLSIAHSKLALPTQFLFLLSNAVGLLVGIIYNSQTPDLYENNAHHKIGWIATWVVSAQVIMSLIFAYTGRGESGEAAYKRATFMPVSTDETDSPTAYPPGSSHEYRWSRDSGQGTERNTSSLHSRPSSACASPTDEYDLFDKPEDHIHEKPERRAWLHNTGMGRFLASRLPQMISSRILRVMSFIYKGIDRIIMPFGFAAIATGGVTYGGLMVSLERFTPSFTHV